MTPETPTERTAIVVNHLSRGARLTPGDIQNLTGLTRSASYVLMYRISRVQPLVLSDGYWQLLDIVANTETRAE